jgi:hypothetical protein
LWKQRLFRGLHSCPGYQVAPSFLGCCITLPGGGACQSAAAAAPPFALPSSESEEDLSQNVFRAIASVQLIVCCYGDWTFIAVIRIARHFFPVFLTRLLDVRRSILEIEEG